MQKSTEVRSDLIGQRDIRIEKIKKLREMGIDPYPSNSYRSVSNEQILKDFKKYEGKEVTVAGRLMSFRNHGNIAFGHIQDPTARLQLYIRTDTLEPTSKKEQTIGFENLDMFDVGDIVEAIGTVTKTERGEVSVSPRKLRMLTKSLRPLPDKWAGLQDKELKFRQRYLDLIMDPTKKWRFEKRSEIVFAIREYLFSKGFHEIKTPIIQSVYGGTNAKPFKTHVNALGVDMYLAIAHELYLKRLIVAGFENVFNIVGYFRNEGIDRSHNPEFELLETMTAYKNYEYNMELTEQMYKYIADKVFGKTTFMVRGKEIDFGKKWDRLMMIDAVKKYAKVDFDKVKTLKEAHTILDGIEFKGDKPNSIGECMVKVFEEVVEDQLNDPVFITGHPVEISPLAKAMPEDPRFVERFEVFIGGIEQGDNWTELNDPIELYERLKAQVDRGRGGDEEAHPMDVEFIEAMEYGMPPTTGLGPGIDRLVMLFTETEYIDDVIFFPLMRPAPITDTQKEIYGEEYLTSKKKRKGVENPVGKKIAGLPTREEALKKLEEYVGDEYQRLHAKMVANAMEEYATEYKENPDLWYITGLLHDLDYDKYPQEHPMKSVELFKQWGYPDQLIHSVLAHDHLNTKVEPESRLAEALLAVDEMCGLLYAYSKMRPERFKGMKVKSALQKFEAKSFAPGISREEILAGVNLFGVTIESHIEMLIKSFEKMEEFK